MEITKSSIKMSSDHQLAERHTVHESLAVGTTARGTRWEPNALAEGVVYTRSEESGRLQAGREALLDPRRMEGAELDRQGIADSRRRALALGGRGPEPRSVSLPDPASHRPVSTPPVVAQVEPALDPDNRRENDLDMQIINAFVKAVTGKEIKLMPMADPRPPPGPADGPEIHSAETAAPQGENQDAGGWGLRYQYRESHREHETTSFTAAGMVHTADGREIRIDLELVMSRDFASDLNVDISLGAALKDPLVINFNGTAAQLTQTRYQFDIDNDGEADQIAFVGPDSGFLALDRNQDGEINNGGELFGTASGNGFADLSQHDSDGNHWIDENDPIYSRLRIWSKDANGADHLVALGARGVGAIYLGSTATPFAIKDDGNALQGEVRRSGIYLTEDGGTGTMQQIDLVT